MGRLFLNAIEFLTSLDSLSLRMGQAYNESYVEFGSKRRVNFCNKVFTAWDFNITDPNTAKLKRVHIRTDFEVPANNCVPERDSVVLLQTMHGL